MQTSCTRQMRESRLHTSQWHQQMSRLHVLLGGALDTNRVWDACKVMLGQRQLVRLGGLKAHVWMPM